MVGNHWSRCATLQNTSQNCLGQSTGADEWQAAMQVLLLVAEHDGPAMFARIGVMKALNRHAERVFKSLEKHWRRVAIVSTARSTAPLRLGFWGQVGPCRPPSWTAATRSNNRDFSRSFHLNATVGPTASTER